MIRVKAEFSESDVFIECPHCDQNCEQHPIDEQRHHIQTYDLEWYKDGKEVHSESGNEVSFMTCHMCKGEFELEWDYSNITVQDED